MKNNEIYYRVIPIVLLYAAVVGVILYFIKPIFVTSFILGTATTLFNYSILIKNIKVSLSREVGTRMGYSMSMQIIRFVIYGSILAVAYYDSRFFIIPTFIGMLSVKIVLFIYILIVRRGD